ncbi:hypothetical protein RUM43_008868 [Polyplax serrata]|uniref:Uncharacterized protein n=1 Tax=Polyplax serrata TaxID=468196 RepID=A0AAN8NZ11_POLSC
MESDDSSDNEDCNFEYWNNWEPSHNPVPELHKSDRNKVVFGRNNDWKRQKAISSLETNEKFGNWVPPENLYTGTKSTGLLRVALKRAQEKNECVKLTVIDSWSNDAFNDSKVFENCRVDLSESKLLENSLTQSFDVSPQKDSTMKFDTSNNWEKLLNMDWGKRVELHDVTSFSEKDTIWGVVKLGTFSSIKVWVNEYGNVCGMAEGTISKEGSSESSCIIINDCQNLRKMLGLHSAQWSCLVEVVQQKKLALKFDTKTEYTLPKMTSMEKLWFYICKRRHQLVDQSMLVKISGAIKSLKDLKIIPKLVVLEIRNLRGHEIP